MKQTSNISGFTLLELLVAIAIIGILATIVLASLNSARDDAREKALIAQVEEVSRAAGVYNLVHGNYGNDDGNEADLNSCTGLSSPAMDQTMFGQTAADNSVTNIVTAVGNLREGDDRVFCVVRSATYSYAFAAFLETPTGASGRAWCVDSSGNSKEVSLLDSISGVNAMISAGSAICP